MTLVRFLAADGHLALAVDVAPGTNLLRLAQAHGQPLEGSCEGAMSCSTCHVILDRATFDRLPGASEEEDDLLDFAAHVAPTSRLACQVDVPDGAPIDVRMPGGAVRLDR